MLTITVAKRELIASSVPLTIVEELNNTSLLSLLARLTLHPVMPGVLHASSHVNSNVLLLILLQVTLYIGVVAELKIQSINYRTCVTKSTYM